MTAEQVFSITSTLALLGWLILAILPRWRITQYLILGGAVPLLLSGVYLVLVVLFFGQAEGGFDSLANVMKLFTNPWAVLAGWIHFLAFDLFVGAWEVRDSQRLQINHLLVIPCLFFTFMLGPIGLLAYMLLRSFFFKREIGDDTAAV